MWYKIALALLVGLVVGTLLLVAVRKFVLRRREGDSLNARVDRSKTNNTIEDWAQLATGLSGDISLEVAWLRTVQELYGIFCQKQHDYGPTNIGTGGLKGVTIRIGDKTSRLFELTGVRSKGDKKAAVKEESTIDTLMDLGDYGIIGVLVARGQWPLFDPEDVWGSERVTLEAEQSE